MKLGGSTPTPAPTQPSAVPNAAPAQTTPTDGAAPSAEPNDKPFDDEPFEAGVEADEESDPKKFIEQLTGKLGQSLRKYSEGQGQPDFDLEKFAINSLLSATHTGEMEPNDQEDIIKKVKKSGNDGDNNNSKDSGDDSNDMSNNSDNSDTNDGGGDLGGDNKDGEENVEENLFEKKENFFLNKPKKLSIFALEGSEESKFKHEIKSKLQETFNQEKMSEPMTKPVVKPAPTKEPSIKPSRKNKPFLPTPSVQPDPKAMDEEKAKTKGYEVYHGTFSAAVQTAAEYAESKGYVIDENEWFNQISTGPRKPDEGKTNRYSIALTLKGKPSKKNLQIQVFNMGRRYELNAYIA